jgi:hypothetical protein
MLIPFVFLVRTYLYHIEEPAYDRVDMLQAFRAAWHNKNIRAALIAEFTVQCFYAVMIIYSPFYLARLGIPLTVYLSFILPFALIPLVVLPFELGFLADTKMGRKRALDRRDATPRTYHIFGALSSILKSDHLDACAFGIANRSCVRGNHGLCLLLQKSWSGGCIPNCAFFQHASLATIAVGAVGIIIGPLLAAIVRSSCSLFWDVSFFGALRISCR